MRYIARLIVEEAVKAAVTIFVGIVLAAAGVGAVKGDIHAALQVPEDIIRGIAALERAANKYLTD